MQNFNGKSTGFAQSLGLDGIENARELGGYIAADGRMVKAGVLLRSGNLKGATSEDLDKLIHKYNLSAIVDFRFPSEVAEALDPELEDVKYYHFSVLGESYEDKFDKPEEVLVKKTSDESVAENQIKYKHPYLTIIASLGGPESVRLLLPSAYLQMAKLDCATESFRQFFDVLLSKQNETVLWHCSFGKDRTGVAGALLLAALGVEQKTIMEDYLLTNVYCEKSISKTVAAAREEMDDEKWMDAIRMLMGVHKDSLMAWIDSIEEQYGSIESYLEKKLGLSKERLESLRDKYLVY